MPTPDTYGDLFFGYTVIWVLIAFYVGRLCYRVSKLEEKLP